MLTTKLRAVPVLAVLMAGSFVLACADAGPLAPTPEMRSDAELSAVTGQPVLRMIRWSEPPSAAVQTSRNIGVLGGTISAAGVTLTIPPLALSRTTKITMTVPADDFVYVDLQPHGLTFRVSPMLTFPIIGTELAVQNALQGVVGVYSSKTPSGGLIEATEVFEVQLLGLVMGFEISHFSTYGPGRGGYVLMGDLKGN